MDKLSFGRNTETDTILRCSWLAGKNPTIRSASFAQLNKDPSSDTLKKIALGRCCAVACNGTTR
jgi:hypothetical protein